MKLPLVLLLIAFSVSSSAQFAIVSDKNGFVNVRQTGSASSKIVDTLKTGHLIYFFEPAGNWANIDYSKMNDGNGYIYKDRCKFISSYSKVPVTKQAANAVTLSNDSIKVTVMEEPFDRTKHALKYSKGSDKFIESVDGKMFYGTDGEMPKKQYKKIVVELGQVVITLPKEATQNLFQPIISHTQVNFDKEKNIIYIQSSNSDGAGSYEIIWKIENGVYKERFVAHGF